MQRLVLLSGRGEHEAQRAEQALIGSGRRLDDPALQLVQPEFQRKLLPGRSCCAGEMALPVGDVGEPFVDADDIADVAVAALTDDGHIGQLYELTGPRLLTFAEAAAEIARGDRPRDPLTSRSRTTTSPRRLPAAVPPDIAWLVGYLFTEVLDGRNAYLPTASSGRSAGARATLRDYASARPLRPASGEASTMTGCLIFATDLRRGARQRADGRAVLRLLGLHDDGAGAACRRRRASPRCSRSTS